MDRIEADLRESEAKQRSLSKAYESVRAQASSLIIFSVQWGDLEDHFESTRKSIESQFRELERRERAAEPKQWSLEAEKEDKARELRGLSDLADQKLKEVRDCKSRLITLQNLIREHSNEVVVQERRLEAVEEFVREKENECEVVEKRLKESTKKLGFVDKSVEEKEEEVKRLKEEVELREKELNENLWLIEVHKKDIDLKEELIKAAQRRIEECDKEVMGKEEKLGSIRKSIEECSKMLESREMKMMEFDVKERSMEEWSCKLVFRERELAVKQKQVMEQQKLVIDGENRLETMSKGLEMKERELEDRAKELALKDRELEFVKTSTEELSEKVKSKERQLGEQRKELELKEKEFASIKKSTEEYGRSLKSKEMELEDQLRALELLKKELNLTKKSTEEQTQVLQSKESQLDLWQKELDSTKKSTEEQTQILKVKEKQIEVQGRELELKLKEFDSTKKSIEEMAGILKLQEGQLKDQTKELELKQKELESMKKSREEHTRNLKAKENTSSVLHPRVKIEQLEYTPSNNADVPSCTSTQSSTNRDGRGLQLFMNEHLKRIDVVGHEVSAVLQASSDPAKLVLDAMEGFYLPDSCMDNRECDFDVGVIRRSCIVLLESLGRVAPQINPQVRQEAIKLSGEWKAKMTTDSENWLEILGFLRLVHAYKITSAYDAKELRSLIAKVGENEQATELSRSLGTTDMASASIICSPVKIEKPEFSLTNKAAIVSWPSIQQTAKDVDTVSSTNLKQCATKDAEVVSPTDLQQTAAKDGATASSLNLEQIVTKDAAIASSLKIQQTYSKDAAIVSSLNVQQTATKVAAIASSSNLQQNANTGEMDLQGFLNALSKGNQLKQDETLAALQRSLDPAKFVLDLMKNSFIEYWGNKDVHFKGTFMLSYINLMEQLMGVLPHGGLHVKSDALELALQWKANMGADTVHPLEPVGLLQLLATYGLISDYPRTHTLMLLRTISKQKQTRELSPALAFADKIPVHYIQNFIEEKQVMTAVRFICSFKLIDTFPPVPLLEKLVVTRMNFFRRACKTKKSPDEKVKVLVTEISELRAVIRCIKDCNLESEYLSRNIESQIVVLERIKEAHKRRKFELEQKDSLAFKVPASVFVQQQQQEMSPASKLVQQKEQNQSPASKFVQQGQNRCIVPNVEQQELNRFGQQKQTNGRKRRRWNQPAPQQNHQKKFKRRSFPQPTHTPDYSQPIHTPDNPSGSHSCWPYENHGYPGPARQFSIPANDSEAGAIPSSGIHNEYHHPRYGGPCHA